MGRNIPPFPFTEILFHQSLRLAAIDIPDDCEIGNIGFKIGIVVGPDVLDCNVSNCGFCLDFAIGMVSAKIECGR